MLEQAGRRSQRRRSGRLRRALPHHRRAAPVRAAGRPGAAAVRLAGSGHLRGPDRGGHRGRARVPPAFRTRVELLGQRRRPSRGAPGSGRIANAVRRVLTEPGLAEAMPAEARRIAPGLLWSAVAAAYREVAASALLASRGRMQRVSGQPRAFTHLFRLTDGDGLFEHAERHRASYRARLLHRRRRPRAGRHRPPAGAGPQVEALAGIYLSFLTAAQHASGRFHNRRAPTCAGSTSPALGDCVGAGALGARHRRRPVAATLGAQALGIASSPAPTIALAPSRATASPPSARPRSSPGGPAPRSARALLADAARHPVDAQVADAWPWPEPRLRYANAVVAGGVPRGRIAARRPAADLELGTGDARLAAGRPRPRGGTCRSCRSAAGHRGVPARLRPAADRGRCARRRLRPGPTPSPGIRGGGRGVCSLRRVVPRRRTTRHPWTTRRPVEASTGCEPLRAQREPGGRVHAGPDLDAFSWPSRLLRSLPMTALTCSSGRGISCRSDADPSRVIAKLFLPGQELLQRHVPGGLGHPSGARHEPTTRSLARPSPTPLPPVRRRHADLAGDLRGHFDLVAHRHPPPPRAPTQRSAALGAYFTQEFSHRGGGALQPLDGRRIPTSPVTSPPGELRFVMSVRGVGEGHVSSIEFRTGGPCPATPYRSTSRAGT